MDTYATKRVRVALFATLAVLLWSSTIYAYELTFSTYFGGSASEGIRDVEVDALGNVYVAGTTRSPDFPTTLGAYDEEVDTSLGTTQWGYNSEIFVAKFSPAGALVWSTIIGGPNSEEAYGLEIDGAGYVVVHGRGAPGSPVTPGVYQPEFKGCGGGDPGNPHNTAQNAYICKLTPDGSTLVWGSFFGIDHLHRDLALDRNNDIYVTWGVRPDENDPAHWETWMDPAWNAHVFQPNPQGGADGGVAKIAADGSAVLWATYLGGSDYDSIEASIDVDAEGYVYVGLQTRSLDIPTTPGALDRTHNGGVDWYVAKLLPDGSDLVYGTYIGDEGNNWLNTHNLVVDDAGNCYSSTCAFDSSFPITRGAVQRRHGGGVDWGIVKLSPTGSLAAGTFLGGSAADNPDGIRIDADGNLVLFGQTGSADFPVSDDAYQPTKGGQDDAVMVKLNPELNRILYSTFLGGNGNDAGRAGCVGLDGSLIVAGATSGSDWPTQNAFQNSRSGSGDALVARLAPPSTITIDPTVTYQTITGWEATAWVAEAGDPALPLYRDALYDALVNDIGINRVRLEVRSGVENENDNWTAYQNGIIEYQAWRSRRYATINDNADPDTIDWSGFHFSEMDGAIEQVVNPLRALMEARGERLYININYVAFTGQITDGAYLHDNPDEYAEFVLATYLHIRDKYGWVPDAWEILLEPDNVAQWNGRLLGEAIVACAAKLEAHGFDPVFIAPSNTNMGNAISYFDRMMDVPGVLPYLREFSYHRYGGVSIQNLQTIASRARQYGLNTSMLEWWTNGNTYRTLHEDLKVGNNSAWQQAVVRGFFDIDDANPNNPTFAINAKTKFTRQYFKFVRPGAVRIEATSLTEAFDPLAFINQDGRHVVVVECDEAGVFTLGGLPAATYGIKYTTASEYDVDLSDQTIAAGQALVATMPDVGVLTVYAKATVLDEQPPSAPTDVAADAEATAVTLTWNAATDDIAVTGYKIYRDSTLIGFAANTSFEDSNVEPDVVYTYEVSAYDGAGNESLLSAPLVVVTPELTEQSALLGYWKFDEGSGTAALDASGNNYLGGVFGATWVSGMDEFALNFDGINDYVRIQTEPALNNLEAITMAAWIYPRVDAHWHVLDKGDGDKRLYAEGTRRTFDGRIRYTGAHAFSKSVSNTVQLNDWQHVAMVWSRATNLTRIYHNGREVSYTTQDVGTGSPLDDTTHPYTIGARGALGEVTFFNGLIDEVRLYRRALTADEVYDLYVPLAPTRRRR
ncbi:MAG: hypothetical protein JSW27_22315 [Phycisphaerales bacterium]|nr:MAG: hypothetical protein JSW27_22315 [Phycisphaerales bacterium]